MTLALSSLLTLASNTTSGSAKTTSSASPVANRLLVWCQGSLSNVAHNAPTAWGLTWSQATQATGGTTRTSIWTAWTGNTDPASGTATANWAANVGTSFWYVASVQYADPAVVQGISSNHAASSSAGTALSNSTAKSDLSRSLAIICNDSNSTANLTAERSGLGNGSAGSTPNRGRCGVQWSNTLWDSQMTWSWSGSIAGSSSIIEIGHVLRMAPKAVSIVKN